MIASPSIETGVSIDLQEHFGSVWGCFQGICPTESVRQALSRLREPVERHVWISQKGMLKIGNGAIYPHSLMKSQQKAVKVALRLLMSVDFEDISSFVDPVYERTWARMACRFNAGMLHYRETVLSGLAKEGHSLIPVTFNPDHDPDLMKQEGIEMKQEAVEGHQEECEAIAQAEVISGSQAEVLEQQRAKTDDERYQLRKHQLEQRYGLEVTADLVKKDDAGWYAQLRLHYFLGVGRAYLEERDSKIFQSALEAGDGAVWIPDLKGALLIHQVVGMEQLGILELLRPDRELRNDDDHLIRLKELLTKNPWQTKMLLNITVNPKASPVTAARQVLRKLGFSLKMVRQEGARGQQKKIYRVVGLDDGRDAVFAGWLERDAAKKGFAEVIRDGNDQENRAVITEALESWFSSEALADVQGMVAAAGDDPEVRRAVFNVVPMPVLRHLGVVA